jgi:type I restriction enzyme S subunit
MQLTKCLVQSRVSFSMDWTEITLGDYIEVLTDYHANGAYEKLKANVTLKSDKDFSVMIRTLNFERGDFEKALIYINEKEYNFLSKSKVYPGDILMNKIADAGSVYFMPDLNSRVSLAMNLFLIRLKPSLNQKFMYYMMKFYEPYIKLYANGAATLTITKDSVRKLKFNVPTKKVQDKIVALVSSYDDLIENNLKRIKLLEEMAKITYEEWFVRMKFPGHETAVFDEEKGLPEGWSNSTLSKECELVMGQSPKSEFYNFNEEGKAFHQGVKDYGYRFPTNTCWTTSGQRLAQSGDILFSVRAPVGRLNIALDEIVLGRGLAAIRHHQNAQSFIFYQLQNIFFEEDMMGGGAIFASVTKNDMLRVELIVPTDNILEKFQDLASNCDENIVSLHKQISLLKEARDILLPRLMTGMIDIEQVELSEAMLQRVEQQEDEMAIANK